MEFGANTLGEACRKNHWLLQREVGACGKVEEERRVTNKLQRALNFLISQCRG